MILRMLLFWRRQGRSRGWAPDELMPEPISNPTLFSHPGHCSGLSMFLGRRQSGGCTMVLNLVTYTGRILFHARE